MVYFMSARSPRIYWFSKEQSRGERYAHKTYNCVVWSLDEKGKEGTLVDRVSVTRHHFFANEFKKRDLLPDLSLDELASVERRRIKQGKYQGPISEDELNEIYQDVKDAIETLLNRSN